MTCVTIDITAVIRQNRFPTDTERVQEVMPESSYILVSVEDGINFRSPQRYKLIVDWRTVPVITQ